MNLSERFAGGETGRGGGAENRGRGEESSGTEGGVRRPRRNRSGEGKINTIKPSPALNDTCVERRQILFTALPVPKSCISYLVSERHPAFHGTMSTRI